MVRIEKRHVPFLNSKTMKLGEGIKLLQEEDGEDGYIPLAAVRPGHPEGREQHIDSAVLEYKQVAKDRIESTEEDKEEAISKLRESRKQNKGRTEKGKADYAKAKKEREDAKKTSHRGGEDWRTCRI